MSIKSVAHGITSVFNWLNSEPDRTYTLRELVPALTNNKVDIGRPAPLSRFERAVERMALVGGLAVGAYYSSVYNDIGPLLILPLVIKGAAWFGAAMISIGFEKIENTAKSVENWAIRREFKKEATETHKPRTLTVK